MRIRTWFLVYFVLPAAAGYSQAKVVDVGKENVQISSLLFYSVGGEPVSRAKYVRVVAGTPYFSEHFMKGKLAMGDGRMYDSLQLKLDMVDHTLLFIGKDGSELVATTSVKGVTLTDSLTGRQHHFIHSSYLPLAKNMDKGWYEILASGHAILYKYIRKEIKENKPYGSATTEQTIEHTGEYYVFHQNNFRRVKKIKELPEILAGKKEELSNYAGQKKWTGKSDEDYAELVTFFNKLIETD
ncbi:MAG: hypothetical protein JNK14_12270 [Chitinophagaceae bacterium]|nr:hypothetical protein [Chitinophagaceae bacterium]